MLVVGGAACVWQDLDQWQQGGVIRFPGKVMCVNKMVEDFPGRYEHAYSNDARYLLAALAARRPELRRFDPPHIATHSCDLGVEHRWPFTGHGTSGFNAIKVAIAMNASEVFIAGIPMDDTHRYNEPQWRPSNFSRQDHRAVEWLKPFADILHPCSGQLANVFSADVEPA